MGNRVTPGQKASALAHQQTAALKRKARFVRAVKAGHNQRASVKAADLASRNAYRAAIGLPLVQSGKDLFTKPHNGD